MDLTSLQGAHDTAAILWFMHGPYGLDIALAQQLIQAGLTPHDLQVIYHQQFRQDFVDIHKSIVDYEWFRRGGRPSGPTP